MEIMKVADAAELLGIFRGGVHTYLSVGRLKRGPFPSTVAAESVRAYAKAIGKDLPKTFKVLVVTEKMVSR